MSEHTSAIFFDMDGTILDWRSGMEETWRAMCEKHCDGTYDPAAMYEAIRSRRDWFWSDAERGKRGRMDLNETSREIVRRAFADSGLTDFDVAHSIADGYRQERMSLLAPYPGAIETLASLQSRGVRMALLTNGEAANQRRSVVRHDLERFFDCIVIEGEFGVGKPDERVFRHALVALSADPAATWMVGDSLESDIAPAIALGLHSVWVDDAGEGLPADGGLGQAARVRPHRIVRAISELL